MTGGSRYNADYQPVEEEIREERGERREEGGERVNLLVEPRSHGARCQVLQVGSSQGEASFLCWSFAGSSLGERVQPRGGFGQPVREVRRVFLELN